MEQLLEELKSVPGVNGAFVFDKENGIVNRNIPAVFKDEKLKKISRSLMKIYSAGSMSVPDLTEVSLFYEESILIIRHIADQRFIVVLFDPSASLNLLTMSLNLVMDDVKFLSSKVEDDRQAGDNAGKVNEKKSIDPEMLMKSGPMSESLIAMQVALAKVMGPIAKIIFFDSLKEWIKTDEPDFATIPRLISILEREINDSEKFDEYRERIIPYIRIDN